MIFSNPSSAPRPIGHYSVAVELYNGIVFLSGQIALDSVTFEVRGNTVEEQTRLILSNIERALMDLGYSKVNIFKINIYLKDMSKFSEFDNVYREFFGDHKPVRTTVGVCELPKGALVEIEVYAYKRD